MIESFIPNIPDSAKKKDLKESFNPNKRIDKADKEKHHETSSSSEYKADKRIEQKEYRDDNGKIYRKGNDLKPNNRYELNGYGYETDKKGRLKSAEGKLQLKTEGKRENIPSRTTLETLGKGDQKKTDERGHVIGDRFKGHSDIGNLVAMDKKLNETAYKSFENMLAKEVAAGKDVYLKVDIKYAGNSNRPKEFRASYTIDGERKEKVFKQR